MTTAFWCLLVATLIPFALAGVTGYFKTRQLGTLDNKNPRIQGQQLEGAGARSIAAQQNAWEALAVFTAAVMVAHLAGVDPSRTATPALLFVAARVLHAILYVANVDILRSLVFLVGLGSCLWLFGMAASV